MSGFKPLKENKMKVTKKDYKILKGLVSHLTNEREPNLINRLERKALKRNATNVQNYVAWDLYRLATHSSYCDQSLNDKWQDARKEKYFDNPILTALKQIIKEHKESLAEVAPTVQIIYTTTERNTVNYITTDFVVYEIRNNEPRFIGEFSAKHDMWLGERGEVEFFVKAQKAHSTCNYKYTKVGE